SGTPRFRVRTTRGTQGTLRVTSPARVAIDDARAQPAADVAPSWNDGAIHLTLVPVDRPPLRLGPFESLGGSSGYSVLTRNAQTSLDVQGTYRATIRDQNDRPVGWFAGSHPRTLRRPALPGRPARHPARGAGRADARAQLRDRLDRERRDGRPSRDVRRPRRALDEQQVAEGVSRPQSRAAQPARPTTSACAESIRPSSVAAQSAWTFSRLSARATRRSTAASWRETLPSSLRRAPAVACDSLASKLEVEPTRLAITASVRASISPEPQTSGDATCPRRQVAPSTPSSGVERHPRTASQASTVQVSSSAHSSSLEHGGTSTVALAASASSRPKPLASSNPGGPMSTAPARSPACPAAGGSEGSFCRSSAATPAVCGDAADVPKNPHDGGHAGNPPAFEIDTPSKPAMSGLARSARAGKSTRAGPRELNASTSSSPGSATSIAATVTTSSSAGCPTMLPAAVPCSSALAPRQKSSRRRGSA